MFIYVLSATRHEIISEGELLLLLIRQTVGHYGYQQKPTYFTQVNQVTELLTA